MWLYAAVALGAPEICDGLDNDGDGNADEAPVLVFMDTDDDGQGDPWAPVIRSDCALPANQVANDRDCDDGDGLIFEGASEVCNGLDDDCDGQIDEDGCVDATRSTRSDSTYQLYPFNVWSWNLGRNQCLNIGYDLVVIDDGDESLFVGGSVFSTGWSYFWIGLFDQNGANSYLWVDGSPVTYDPWWPTEPNESYYPCAYSTYDGWWADWSCDSGSLTETVCEVVCTQRTWYADLDEDGFGNPTTPITACQAPAHHVANDLDCDDGAIEIHPTATDVCGGGDEDCDPATTPVGVPWYLDHDGDGYGDPGDSVLACSQPSGRVSDATDCHDGRADVSPDAVEDECDGVDENCNHQIDENLTSEYYEDLDGDGLGSTTIVLACGPGAGVVANSDDCDDTNDTILGESTWYEDLDDDGYGRDAQTMSACAQPAQFSALGGDCDDTNPLASPAVSEVCNGIDDDCDGHVDTDAVVGTDTWYADADGDGYGDQNAPVVACSQPSGTVTHATDCDDASDQVFPGATEACDGADDDCNGAVDDGLPAGAWYPDLDGDGFGDADAEASTTCGAASGEVADHSDCDDTTDAVNPDATEIPNNGVDEDCDGQDATGPQPPTPTDPPDTGDTVHGAPHRVSDAGCQCNAGMVPARWGPWIRR